MCVGGIMSLILWLPRRAREPWRTDGSGDSDFVIYLRNNFINFQLDKRLLQTEILRTEQGADWVADGNYFPYRDVLVGNQVTASVKILHNVNQTCQ